MNNKLIKIFTRGIFQSTLVFAGGCAGNLPQLEKPDIPADWEFHTKSDGALSDWREQQWWDAFSRPELSEYIAEVRSANLDLSTNRRNLEIAQIQLKSAGLEWLPEPSLDLSLSNSIVDTLDDGQEKLLTRNRRLALEIEYSDILKKPGQYRSARASYDSSIAQAADTALKTYTTAASAYFNLLFIHDKIESANKNLSNAHSLLKIVQSKVNAGTTTEIDALQQKIALEKQRNNLRSLNQNELTALATLALLVGKNLKDFNIPRGSLLDINVPAVTAGIPSDLLVRRPSIVQAEAELRVSHANVELARMAFLPTISLTGGAGFVSESLSELMSDPTKIVSASIQVAQNILDNGSRRRASREAKLKLQNSLDSYRKVVISAFNEVELGLNNIALQRALTKVSEEDLHRAEEAYRIAKVRYERGAGDYQTLLSTQNSLFDIRNTYLQNKLNRLTAALTLYQLLGGGWEAGNSESIERLVGSH